MQAKSGVRTPNGSMQSHPVVSCNLPKSSAASVSASAGNSKAKLEKLQSSRTTPNTKPDFQQTPLKMKPKFPALQEASKAATKKVFRSPSNIDSYNAVSSKVKNKTPLKSGSESKLNGKEAGTERVDIAIHEKDASFVETNGSLDMLRDKLSLDTEGHTIITLFIPISNSEEVVADALHAKHNFKIDFQSLNNTNENESAHFEDQVDCLTKQVQAMDVTVGTQKILIDDSLSSPHCNFGSEDKIGAPQFCHSAQKDECLDSLSEPTLSLSPKASENRSSKRIPFAVKDSLYNIGGLLDISTGLTVSEVEKDSHLALSEEHMGRTAIVDDTK